MEIESPISNTLGSPGLSSMLAVIGFGAFALFFDSVFDLEEDSVVVWATAWSAKIPIMQKATVVARRFFIKGSINQEGWSGRVS